MNDIDILRRAKYYMDCMSAGENPITNEPFSPDSEITSENFCKCFRYISSVLGEEIERRSHHGAKYICRPGRAEFYLSDELKKIVQISSDPVGINTVAARINDVIDQNAMKGVSGGKLAECLVKMGYLTVEEMPSGGRVRSATEMGSAAGIQTIDKTDSVGKAYRQNVYSTEMQRFLIENINEIIGHAKATCHSHSENECGTSQISDIDEDGEDDFYGL